MSVLHPSVAAAQQARVPLTRHGALGAIALAVTGLIHFALAPHHAQETPALGFLFALGGGASLMAAPALFLPGRAGTAAWWLAALTAGGMLVALLVARTTGLPGVQDHHGWESSAVVALAAEAVVLACVAVRLARRRP